MHQVLFWTTRQDVPASVLAYDASRNVQIYQDGSLMIRPASADPVYRMPNLVLAAPAELSHFSAQQLGTIVTHPAFAGVSVVGVFQYRLHGQDRLAVFV